MHLHLQVGLYGEGTKIFTPEGLNKVKWTKMEGRRPALTWFKVMQNILVSKHRPNNFEIQKSDFA